MNSDAMRKINISSGLLKKVRIATVLAPLLLSLAVVNVDTFIVGYNSRSKNVTKQKIMNDGSIGSVIYNVGRPGLELGFCVGGLSK
ncbi:MAG: hypothetical protein AABW50_01300 [Nanoarchaeota archaeon]